MCLRFMSCRSGSPGNFPICFWRIAPAAEQGLILRNLVPVRLRNFRNIQLVAKSAGQGHIAPGGKRSVPAHRMVGAVRHMGSHSGKRINQRRRRNEVQTRGNRQAIQWRYFDERGDSCAGNVGGISGTDAGVYIRKFRLRKGLTPPLIYMVSIAEFRIRCIKPLGDGTAYESDRFHPALSGDL